MFILDSLKAAKTREDAAGVLGFRTKSLAYVLYKQPAATKYTTFEIPKRSGGTRVISAPSDELKNLQGRLATLLERHIQNAESHRAKPSSLSHGFRPGYSIFTNAARHRRKKFVFNIDLEDFFGSINFGRVRGYFLKQRGLLLAPEVATVFAQIACHNNSLPQGSPCSPVISNLVAHILDIRLANLARSTGCTYSRYADDITFSTNKRSFPREIGFATTSPNGDWSVGNTLSKIIKRAGFSVNSKKTRMQFAQSRQEVTGLVVNRRINVPSEYRHLSRALVHNLTKTGSFYVKSFSKDATGNTVVTEKKGTYNQLGGMLAYIDSAKVFSLRRQLPEVASSIELHVPKPMSCEEKVYKRFLLYTAFHAPKKPTIVFEGKTDSIYIRSALLRLAATYPALIGPATSSADRLMVRLFERSATTGRILGIPGGSSQLVPLIVDILSEAKGFKEPIESHPVIFLIDNDEGAAPFFSFAKKQGIVCDRTSPYVHLGRNVYFVPTPQTAAGGDTMIENFFEKAVLDTELNGKKFNPNTTSGDTKTHYGKAYFATHVIKKREKTISFDGFKPILDRIQMVLHAHSTKAVAAPGSTPT